MSTNLALAPALDAPDLASAAQTPLVSVADAWRIAESIPHIVWMSAPDGATTYFNTRGSDYTGFPPETNYDWGWVDLIHPDDVDRARRAWERATVAQTEYRMEYRIRRFDGVFRWHRFQALPMRSPSGQVMLWIGTATDIEDLKRLQAGTERLGASGDEPSSSEARPLRSAATGVAAEVLAAMDDGRLVVRSQPLRPLEGGESHEQLSVRLTGPAVDGLTPATFLPIVKEYGLGAELDRRMIGLAVARAAERSAVVHVEICELPDDHSELLALIEGEIRDAGVDPARLVFVVHESELMRNLDNGEAFARGLIQLGCGLALSGFCSGRGSLCSVDRIPITHLMIDGEYVREMAFNLTMRRVVVGVASIARAFGLQTIAIGVDNEQILGLLRAEHVDLGQGLAFGAPEVLDVA